MPAKTMAETSLRIEQSEKYQGDDWWSWSVWVAGPEPDLDAVQLVEYTLHPTFRNPVRTVRTRHNRFKLKEAGWGVFTIYARVYKKDGTVIRLKHQLKLTYPDGEPNVE